MRAKVKPKHQTIKDKCLLQRSHFAKWNAQQKWASFHSAHYDWWAFPIDKPSSYGSAYQVGKEEHAKLIKDEEFIQALRDNAVFVCRSWGWELGEGVPIVTKDGHQKWQDWPVRLYKMTLSLEIFEQHDLLRNAVKYGLSLIEQKKYFVFRKTDLALFFTERHCLLKKQEE